LIFGKQLSHESWKRAIKNQEKPWGVFTGQTVYILLQVKKYFWFNIQLAFGNRTGLCLPFET